MVDITFKYERGEIQPSIDITRKLSDALGVPLDYLVGGGNLKILG